jgi:hypothetical protein
MVRNSFKYSKGGNMSVYPQLTFLGYKLELYEIIKLSHSKNKYEEEVND